MKRADSQKQYVRDFLSGWAGCYVAGGCGASSLSILSICEADEDLLMVRLMLRSSLDTESS